MAETDKKQGGKQPADEKRDAPYEQGAKIKPQDKVGDKKPNPGHPV